MKDLAEAEEFYASTGQHQMASIIRNERETNWVLSHLQAGKDDALFMKIDQLNSAKPEDLQNLSFDPTAYDQNGKPISIQQRAEQLRAKASQIQQAYQEVTSALPGEQSARIEEAVKLKSRVLEMNRQIDSLAEQRNEIAHSYGEETQVAEVDALTRRLKALEENHTAMSLS